MDVPKDKVEDCEEGQCGAYSMTLTLPGYQLLSHWGELYSKQNKSLLMTLTEKEENGYKILIILTLWMFYIFAPTD